MVLQELLCEWKSSQAELKNSYNEYDISHERLMTVFKEYMQYSSMVEVGNSQAKSDIIIDKEVICQDVPVSLLINLEGDLEEFRKQIARKGATFDIKLNKLIRAIRASRARANTYDVSDSKIYNDLALYIFS